MVQRFPGVVARHPRGVGILQQDQHDVVGAVAIELALHVEVLRPLLARREVGDADAESFEQY